MTPTSPAGSAPGEDALRGKIEKTTAAVLKDRWDRKGGSDDSFSAGCEEVADAVLAVIQADRTALLASKEAAEREAEEAKDEIEALRLHINLNCRPVFSRRQIIAERDALARMVGEMSAELAKVTIERDHLRRDLDGCASVVGHSPVQSCPVASTVGAATADLQARIAGLEAENASLFEALEPFSVMAGEIERHHPGWDHDEFWFRLGGGNGPEWTLRPFRAARELRLSIKAARAALRDAPSTDVGGEPGRDPSRDFQMMLGRIIHRYRKGLDISKAIDGAHDLLARKGTLSILRAETPIHPDPDPRSDPETAAGAMRERCAKLCDGIHQRHAAMAAGAEERGNESGAVVWESFAEGARACAAAIRVLPLTPTEGEAS